MCSRISQSTHNTCNAEWMGEQKIHLVSMCRFPYHMSDWKNTTTMRMNGWWELCQSHLLVNFCIQRSYFITIEEYHHDTEDCLMRTVSTAFVSWFMYSTVSVHDICIRSFMYIHFRAMHGQWTILAINMLWIFSLSISIWNILISHTIKLITIAKLCVCVCMRYFYWLNKLEHWPHSISSGLQKRYLQIFELSKNRGTWP